MDKDSRLTIEYLRAQPRGGVVRWASDHVTVVRPWATAWIDVRIPDGGPPGMSWVWTILSPDDRDQGEPDQLWQFPWPKDLPDGWSPEAVCEALRHWASEHAGRPDLRFEWDPGAGDSETLEIIKDRAASDAPTWDLGDGVKVADGVMDDLLALHPDDAARITSMLREAANRQSGDD